MHWKALAQTIEVDALESFFIVLAILLGALMLAVGVWLILVAPGKKKGVSDYKGALFAHRGLHGDGRAENSASSFRAAVEAGYGIELDVRLSKDGKLVVFHDDTLERVVGREGRVDSYTAEELGKMSLDGTADGVPLFCDVLEMIGGRVPLLVEIKEDAGDSRVSAAAAEMLAGYGGPYLVESFNPLSLANFSKRLPGVACGILSHRYYAYESYRKPLYFLLQCLLLNRVCRPAFIAYDHRHAGSLALRASRALGAVTFAWTIRSEEEQRVALEKGFDGVIFENYLPRR